MEIDKYSLIDIETTGSFKHGQKIIEIAIINIDGDRIVDEFSTLINPEMRISLFITNLTGITNEEVSRAPRFFEVAKKIIEMTEGKIFVAHNVGFDYGFIKDEFASLGYKYKRETLCTVRLSRKLIPGKVSYSLGNLCSSLGIEIENRHRAEGDVDATVKLFDRLLELKSMHPQYKNQGVEELMTRRIDKIKQYIKKTTNVIIDCINLYSIQSCYNELSTLPLLMIICNKLLKCLNHLLMLKNILLTKLINFMIH
jgi:DNA polymerase III epsilon subunit family exonuclease